MADMTLPWLQQWLQGGAQGQRAVGAGPAQQAQPPMSQGVPTTPTNTPGTSVQFTDPNAQPQAASLGFSSSPSQGHTLNGVSIFPTSRPNLTANFLQHQDPLGLSDKILGSNGPSAWVRKLL
jgi:hypothetical protein